MRLEAVLGMNHSPYIPYSRFHILYFHHFTTVSPSISQSCMPPRYHFSFAAG
jgi:hypothetical protein